MRAAKAVCGRARAERAAWPELPQDAPLAQSAADTGWSLGGSLKHRIHSVIKPLPEEYQNRWSIEAYYRQTEQVRIRTRSRLFQLRLFLFYFSAIVANMWVQANCIIPGGRKSSLATKLDILLEDFAHVLGLYSPEYDRSRRHLSTVPKMARVRLERLKRRGADWGEGPRPYMIKSANRSRPGPS